MMLPPKNIQVCILLNVETVTDHYACPVYGPIFEEEVPESVKGFELEKEDRELMIKLWPAGSDVAEKILHGFLANKATTDGFKHPALKSDEDKSKDVGKELKSEVYKEHRNRPDVDGTSRLSAYLAAGVVSPRATLRATIKQLKNQTDPVGAMIKKVRDYPLRLSEVHC